MSSRQIVASCAAMALIGGMGSWYAVSAFPLHATGQSGAEQQLGPGPLERSAHAVTPENPIPRRVQSAPPVFPDGQGTSRAMVTVRLTLDALGRIAEARVTGLAVKGNGFDFNLSFPGGDIGPQMEGSARVAAPETASHMRDASTAFMDAALVSVRQWRYDPPAEAPLTFNATFVIAPQNQDMVFKPAADDGALRVGGNIKPPRKVRDVRPDYPPIARAANVTGVVIIEVRIGTDGRVEDAHVLRSIPLLDQAALEAVNQWEFTPTLMNGQAVPIIMTVTVNFTME